MLISLNELRLKINDIEEEIRSIQSNLDNNALKVTIKELSGHQEVLTPEFNFDSELNTYVEKSELLARYKTAVAKANNTTFVDEKLTIQGALNTLQEKRRVLNLLNRFTEKRDQTSRQTDGGSYASGSAYYKLVELNYNKNEIIKMRDEIKSLINSLEVKVAEANNSVKVEV